MKVKLYTVQGRSTKEVVLPKKYTDKVNKNLLLQAVKVYENRDHTGLSKVKTRSEVVRTKKKLYKQKGTGGARHGAKSAPIFVGGGVAHGPKGLKRILSMPDKMRKAALSNAVSYMFYSKKAALVEGIGKVSKTNAASKIVKTLRSEMDVKKNSKVLVVLSKKSYENARYFKNIENLETVQFETLNAHKLLKSGFIFFEAVVFVKENDK